MALRIQTRILKFFMLASIDSIFDTLFERRKLLACQARYARGNFYNWKRKRVSLRWRWWAVVIKVVDGGGEIFPERGSQTIAKILSSLRLLNFLVCFFVQIFRISGIGECRNFSSSRPPTSILFSLIWGCCLLLFFRILHRQMLHLPRTCWRDEKSNRIISKSSIIVTSSYYMLIG